MDKHIVGGGGGGGGRTYKHSYVMVSTSEHSAASL